MARAPSSGGPVGRPIGLYASEAPDDLVGARLALAASVTRDLSRTEAVVAGVVVGSTALRRCSVRADLDLVVITPATQDGDRFSTRRVDGTLVEVERLGRDDALALTTGDGWVWELRNAARLGTGIPVFDPDGFAGGLLARAAAMVPSAARYEDTLRGVYETLIELAGPAGSEPGRRLDALRGCLDNLALLALLERPRRYQKPKWVLADLLHAGEDDLVDALLAAYGIADGPGGGRAAITPARGLIDAAFGIAGAPTHDDLLAMGHAPDWAEVSYVSRTLDDAEDLAASGRAIEARYTALFAARLAAGLLGATTGTAGATSGADADATSGDTTTATDGADAAGAGVVDVFARHGLAERYLALFPEPGTNDVDLLPAALAAAGDRRRALEAMVGTTRATAAPTGSATVRA